MELSDDNAKGTVLAVSSSLFIGSSFIIKKRGLRLAGANGVRAGVGGYTYLKEPLWWTGMLALFAGELANFAAYAFAPAILVTPLGALSVIVSAILAHHILQERLNLFGILGCLLCITGSIVIVLHAPEERPLFSVSEIWYLASRPAFLTYVAAALVTTLALIWAVPPNVGKTNIFVYIAICSIVGSLSVISCKALGIAVKLTIAGDNQLFQTDTFYCIVIVVACVVTQMNYLNKALDLFNTAIVSPIYYVMFTSLTVSANVLLFQEKQRPADVISQLCGFVTIIVGTFILHATRSLDVKSDVIAELAKPKTGVTESRQGLPTLSRSASGLFPVKKLGSEDP